MRNKERVLTGMLAIVMLAASMMWSTDVVRADDSDDMSAGNISVSDGVDMFLDEYFAERENEFYGSSVVQSGCLTQNLDDRLNHIDAWLDDLGIVVLNVESSHYVEDTLADTEFMTKLQVYEWVWIDYQWLSNGEIERMGFGTTHILNIAKNDGLVSLVSDSYSELNGYETGTSEDLALLNALKCDNVSGNVESMEIQLSDTEIESMRTAAASYSASSAISYANKWSGTSEGSHGGSHYSSYNPIYDYFTSDCCNFVSQCLVAGGISMDTSSWFAKTYSRTSPVLGDAEATSLHSYSWLNTVYFMNYWKNIYEYESIDSETFLSAGDVLFWLASDGNSTNHIMLITKVTSSYVYVTAHTNDAHNYPMSITSLINQHNHMYTIHFAG